MSISSSFLSALIVSLSVTNDEPEPKLLLFSELREFTKNSFSPGV